MSAIESRDLLEPLHAGMVRGPAAATDIPRGVWFVLRTIELILKVNVCWCAIDGFWIQWVTVQDLPVFVRNFRIVVRS